MPYYGLATRAQAVVMQTLGTPLKLITEVTGISGKHIGNLLKKAVENGWRADWVLLDDHLRDKPRVGRTKKITPDIEQRVINAVTCDRYGREKSSQKIGRQIGISAASV
jgi:hypothetical protein